MKTIRILDLFCCAGGAAVGYYQAFTEAGYRVRITGVDIKNQPRYPYKFYQADALKFFDRHKANFDFYHASPPCQAHTNLRAIAGKEYACFIEDTRNRFQKSGKPYVIENVVNAPLIKPVLLCGLNVGLPMHGHRLFETYPAIDQPIQCSADRTAQQCGRPPTDGHLLARPAGHFSGVDAYRKALGVPWMNQAEIAQCIPPAFSHWVAKSMIDKKAFNIPLES